MARATRDSRPASREELFDHAVFKRMEAHAGEASMGLEEPRRRLEPARELAELVVHINAQGLESACGWVHPIALRRGSEGLGDDVGELTGARDWTRSDD